MPRPLGKQFQLLIVTTHPHPSLSLSLQKKSREESEGRDSAVEILENRPYTDGPQGCGQYTYKIFHIGEASLSLTQASES